MPPFFRLLDLSIPIFEQLRLEEALLRTSEDNWCIINRNSPPAIVMGISGKVAELVDVEKAEKASIGIIRRFSGGGTVVVDPQTLFVTFICNQQEVIKKNAYAEDILRWAVPHFPLVSLQENDFVIGEKKCAGNALYIQKNRWLIHTSFLWNWDKKLMDILLIPSQMPLYRKKRGHEDFLIALSSHWENREDWIQQVKQKLIALMT